jgi:hypothetical protein
MVGAALVTVLASASMAALPEDRCTAMKLRAAEKKARGLIACQAQAVLQGRDADPACIEKCERKFVRVWSRIESRGGCATVGDGDSIEAIVDAFVDDLSANLRTTTTTTTTTSTSCPPPTALYCGVSGCAPLPALCPTGMSCQTVAEGCGCVGPAIPCGDASLSGLSGDFCRWGTCPAGTTCGRVAKPDACGFDCTCQ